MDLTLITYNERYAIKPKEKKKEDNYEMLI